MFTYSSGSFDKKQYGYLENVNIYSIPVYLNIRIPIVSYLINYVYQIAKTISGILKCMRLNEVNVLFVSIPQLQPLIIGYFVKLRNKRIKLIEEIRDIYSIGAWIKNNWIKYIIIRLFEEKLMKKVDEFICVTSIIKSEYIKEFVKVIPKLLDAKVILNGYDPEDYGKVNCQNNSKEITFSYTGKLFGTRNLDIFLESLGNLKGSGYMNDGFVVNIAGEIENKVKLVNIISGSGIEDNVKLWGLIDHKEVISLQQQSTFNILVTHRTESYYAIPSKLYEYAGSRRPIIAFSDDVLVKELISENKLGYCFSNTKDDIANGLKKVLDEKKFSNIDPPANFSRELQIKEIIKILN